MEGSVGKGTGRILRAGSLFIKIGGRRMGGCCKGFMAFRKAVFCFLFVAGCAKSNQLLSFCFLIFLFPLAV